MISGVYNFLIKQNERRENDNPLYFFVYDYLMNHYGGLQKTAEKKFRSIISSSLCYEDKLPKIRMFLRLITILYHDPYEFDGIELNFYLDTMKKIDEESKKDPGKFS